MSIRQLSWWVNRRAGNIEMSSAPYDRRFSIVKTTSGYTVFDHETGERTQTITKAAARAWAGIRVGEQCVRHQ